jgi:glycosyltransferase involved in cell wall biosynthesis
MKGFHVLFEALAELWKNRQDFELHVTADRSSYEAPFLRYRGWQDQQSLPSVMAECHVIVVPTIAQEALGRTAVEAMGAGRPVIASRIGGLPFTVTEGLTGLLAESADPSSLAQQCERLMDNPSLAERLGEQGRKRFLEHHTWEFVIEKQYRPLMSSIGVNS